MTSESVDAVAGGRENSMGLGHVQGTCVLPYHLVMLNEAE